ncbi:hypothetical protein UF75_5351 [Desulfosporosinus sp. I2]|uniref:hypothetical protein n=1 Tax=Desulfosporosinus sp. I2 TaxID=1617025 RepID=UPI0005F0BC83|nr:hypothetical protein [Desulfosporosinus sp. I2]KJR44268.1 hypothetical protein UF75_5351 [Desulfosporosinus sp. I2]
MDNIKQIAIANICRLLSDVFDYKEDDKWSKIFKCAGQREYYSKYSKYLNPYWYNGKWQNIDSEYSPFFVLDEVLSELYDNKKISEMALLLKYIVSEITPYLVENKDIEFIELNYYFNILGYNLTYENQKCILKSYSDGAVERIMDISEMNSWLDNYFSKASLAYTNAINAYARGEWGPCIGECRVALTGFFSYFKETEKWFSGILKVTKDSVNTADFKQVNKIFQDSNDGEYTRFKAIYRIYSMLSDLGTHRLEGVIEIPTQQDALMSLRMVEDILIWAKMSNLELLI